MGIVKRYTAVRRAALAGIAIGVGACTHRAYVVYDANSDRYIRSPVYVGTGDSVMRIIRDSSYRNRYAAQRDTEHVFVGDSAAV